MYEERPVRQTVLTFFLKRNDLHRNVAGRGIKLEVIEHRPAQHIGQENVEGDRGGQVLPREDKPLLAALGHNSLKSLVARQPQ